MISDSTEHCPRNVALRTHMCNMGLFVKMHTTEEDATILYIGHIENEMLSTVTAVSLGCYSFKAYGRYHRAYLYKRYDMEESLI